MEYWGGQRKNLNNSYKLIFETIIGCDAVSRGGCQLTPEGSWRFVVAKVGSGDPRGSLRTFQEVLGITRNTLISLIEIQSFSLVRQISVFIV